MRPLRLYQPHLHKDLTKLARSSALTAPVVVMPVVMRRALSCSLTNSTIVLGVLQTEGISIKSAAH